MPHIFVSSQLNIFLKDKTYMIFSNMTSRCYFSTLSVPDEGDPRNGLCALNLKSSFFMFIGFVVSPLNSSISIYFFIVFIWILSQFQSLNFDLHFISIIIYRKQIDNFSSYRIFVYNMTHALQNIYHMTKFPFIKLPFLYKMHMYMNLTF